MESLSSVDRQTALHILDRIEEAIQTVQTRNVLIRTADDFLLTPEGKEKMDAACMVIEAIGESFKNLDKLTNYELLPMYPSIEWKEVKGVRDVIAHHYFDIDANEIFSIINNDFDSLRDAIRFFKDVLTSNALDLFKQQRAAAEASGEPELTLDEINEEIRAARANRGKK